MGIRGWSTECKVKLETVKRGSNSWCGKFQSQNLFLYFQAFRVEPSRQNVPRKCNWLWMPTLPETFRHRERIVTACQASTRHQQVVLQRSPASFQRQTSRKRASRKLMPLEEYHIVSSPNYFSYLLGHFYPKILRNLTLSLLVTYFVSSRFHLAPWCQLKQTLHWWVLCAHRQVAGKPATKST